MNMRRLLVLVALAISTAACGASSAPSPGGPGFEHTATNTDHQVTMHVGEKLEVVLHAAQGMNTWSHPSSSDASVLEPIVDPAATAVIGVTLAAFEAVRPGAVDVTANASPRCSPGQACPMYVALYSLRVTVTQ